MSVDSRYTDGTYFKENPEWDRKDAQWKAVRVADIIEANQLSPLSICDIGCGTGDVLAQLRSRFPNAALTGFDISPQLKDFWSRHSDISFHASHFHFSNKHQYDVILMLDVFEHVRDPFSFLERSGKHAKYFVFHIPLDLSAVSVLRGSPLLAVRRKVGHLHFYTKDLALETLSDTGYHIIDWQYTNASLTAHRSFKTKLAQLPRRLAYAIHKDFGARLLGGETLLVLASHNGA